MHKAAKGIRETLSQVDLFLELLDARIPASSANPMISELRGDKQGVRVLTKSDLADPETTKLWQNWLQTARGIDCVVTCANDRQQIKSLAEYCRALVDPDRQRLQPITIMVVGIPNVGKSTFINILADRTIAKTGNEAAITRGQQRIKLDSGIALLDTPGVLWPNVENPASGFRLASTGAIRDSAISHHEVAWFLAEFLLNHYPDLVDRRYQAVFEDKDPEALMVHIGHQRGCLKAGGQVDFDRVAKILINEFREGKIGRITMETPSMISREEAEVEKRRLEKAEKKRQRKKKWKGSG